MEQLLYVYHWRTSVANIVINVYRESIENFLYGLVLWSEEGAMYVAKVMDMSCYSAILLTLFPSDFCKTSDVNQVWCPQC